MICEIDEGYQYGIGVFETISVVDGRAVFLERHMQRMEKSLKRLHIGKTVSKTEILCYLRKNYMKNGVLKICVSEENILFLHRDNTYHLSQYQKGFEVATSKILRNETDTCIYHKMLNCAVNILEKRNFAKQGMDEPVFINTKGYLAEGATTNIFFVKGESLYTPDMKCGLLPGVMRDYIIENYQVRQDFIKKEDVQFFDEMFLTNSLLGIMPVRKFHNIIFDKMEMGKRLNEEYLMKRADL